MAYTPITLNKLGDWQLALKGAGAYEAPIFGAFEGQGYGAIANGEQNATAGTVVAYSNWLLQNNFSSIWQNNGGGGSQRGRLINDKFIYVTIGPVPGEYYLYSQLRDANQGNDFSAPAITDIFNYSGPIPTPPTFTFGSIYTPTTMGDNSVGLFVNNVGASPQEMYLVEIGEVSATIYNAFEFEVDNDEFGDPRVIYDTSFKTLFLDSVNNVIALADFTLETYETVFNYTKYSIDFDDAALNALITGGSLLTNGINSSGFIILFENYAGGFATRQYVGVYILADLSGYYLINISGDADAEIYADNNLSIGIDELNTLYALGENTGSVILAPASPAKFTRNPQPVSLACSNYCIPLLKRTRTGYVKRRLIRD